MPVTEHPHVSIDDDLIGYTDWWLDASARAGRPIAGWVTLIKRLRAALAARPQPLFEGTIIDNGESASTPIVLVQMRRRRPLLDLDEWTGDEVVVYPAASGSATPGGDDNE